MEKPLSKLEVKDIATIEVINKTKIPSKVEFEHTKEKLTTLKNDAEETAQCLASINTKIQDYLEKMEKIKRINM